MKTETAMDTVNVLRRSVLTAEVVETPRGKTVLLFMVLDGDAEETEVAEAVLRKIAPEAFCN